MASATWSAPRTLTTRSSGKRDQSRPATVSATRPDPDLLYIRCWFHCDVRVVGTRQPIFFVRWGKKLEFCTTGISLST